MVYTVLAAVVAVLGLLIVLAAARILINPRWLLGWLRGMSGLLLVAAAAGLLFVALDLYSYKQLQREQVIANLSFQKLDDQQFKVSVVDAEGREQLFELAGDLWQLDARLLNWQSPLPSLGLLPGYRLDRLSGRYLALKQEREAERSVFSLSASKSPVDVWQWLQGSGQRLALVNSSYGSATYLPMADGALFSVSLTATGLRAQAVNERARRAIEQWD